ncbi:hypothetical protein CC78DRAFT_541691 [Lojkania enalia]|uniref:Uncharacterized protein n=1 Tax=Lojkania enalia TaxID=147567 RepID=A0A9P4KEY0_9PLEO|nr:hypothetical protein CC78DRAFT_541691 [Didymosphaeria enalia]
MTDQSNALYAEAITMSPINSHGPEHSLEEGQGKGNTQSNQRDRDSGVFLSDSEAEPTPSKQSSVPSKHGSSPSKSSTTSTSASTETGSTPRRLRRPAELDLSNPTSSTDRPKSELELRFDQIRNSSSQNRATLKSPTQLLKDRLNLSPKKEKEERVRVFTPPRPMLNGCILPPPQAQLTPFSGSSVCARTEKTTRPAWWCKVDRVVIFDGVDESLDGEGNEMFMTRSSKGLSIARRKGDLETVVIPMDCEHCREMLNRDEWKYDVRVCKRGVCWECLERCRWEMEEERRRTEAGEALEERRVRADSLLEDDSIINEELCAKVGIETGERSPIEAVGGIEERLESGL